jgi:hypothetical protein
VRRLLLHLCEKPIIERHHLLLDGGRLPVAVYILLEVGLLLLLLLLLRLLLSATAGRRGALEEFAVQQRLQLGLLRQVVVELRLRLVVALCWLLGRLPAPVSGVVLRRSLLLHKVGRGLCGLRVETAAVHVGRATTALLHVAGKAASATTHAEAGGAVGTQSLRGSRVEGAVLRAVAAVAVPPTT